MLFTKCCPIPSTAFGALTLALITQFQSVISSVQSGHLDRAAASPPACCALPTAPDCSIFDRSEDAVLVQELHLCDPTTCDVPQPV